MKNNFLLWSWKPDQFFYGAKLPVFANYCHSGDCLKRPVLVLHGIVSLSPDGQFDALMHNIHVRTPLCHEHANDLRIYMVEREANEKNN